MIDFPAINRALLAEARTLLPEWLPGGQFTGREYVAGNVTGGKGRSFRVNVFTGRWTDRATGQKGGDLISLYAETHGLTQGAAARELLGLAPVSAPQPQPERRTQADGAEYKSAAARRIWLETRPAAGTLVEDYFRSRGITIPPPPSIRFHPALKHRSGHVGPAMVSGAQDVAGKFVAVQRVWLRIDGGGKFDVEPCRMSLGPTAGAAVRLAEATTQLVIAEGVETGLSIVQRHGRPTWACLGTAGLRAVEIPACVQTLYIAADADAAGERAACVAANQFIRRQIPTVKTVRPPAGKDFNDLLREA